MLIVFALIYGIAAKHAAENGDWWAVIALTFVAYWLIRFSVGW